jgi:hypothetical protein
MLPIGSGFKGIVDRALSAGGAAIITAWSIKERPAPALRLDATPAAVAALANCLKHLRDQPPNSARRPGLDRTLVREGRHELRLCCVRRPRSTRMVADRFDVVAVGVQHESPIIARVVVGS